METLWRSNIGGYDLLLEFDMQSDEPETGFRVTYGQEVQHGLNYAQAGKALGFAILHGAGAYTMDTEKTYATF